MASSQPSCRALASMKEVEAQQQQADGPDRVSPGRQPRGASAHPPRVMRHLCVGVIVGLPQSWEVGAVMVKDVPCDPPSAGTAADHVNQSGR